MHRGIINPISYHQIRANGFTRNRRMTFYVTGADSGDYSNNLVHNEVNIYSSQVSWRRGKYSVSDFPTYRTASNRFFIYKRMIITYRMKNKDA